MCAVCVGVCRCCHVVGGLSPLELGIASKVGLSATSPEQLAPPVGQRELRVLRRRLQDSRSQIQGSSGGQKGVEGVITRLSGSGANHLPFASLGDSHARGCVCVVTGSNDCRASRREGIWCGCDRRWLLEKAHIKMW